MFFIEYLPPLRRVHVPFDLAGYHYSLNDYAFQALRHGRMPQWDPSIACGLSFAANAQAATFYPPIWLLYLANLHRPRLSFLTLEIFVFLHVWLAFVLCHAWLARRKLSAMACLLGAGTFAFSGYVMLQLQHLGLICAYAWMPLGLAAIDESFARASWRPLWKLAAASALAFLAGYPPTWAVFGACVLAYAIARRPLEWRNILGVIYALALSLLLSMVQLLPSWEASVMAQHDAHYGSGIRAARFYLSYLLPNFFDFGIHTPVHTNAGYEYLYLGAPAVFALAWMFRRGARRGMAPLWAMLAINLAAVVNPLGAVALLLGRSVWLNDLVRSWYFLAGITAALAPLAAAGMEEFLDRPAGRFSSTGAMVILADAAAWTCAEVRMARAGLPVGWQSAWPAVLTLFLFAAAAWSYRSAAGRWRIALGTALVLLAGVDYQIWGASLRVNAEPGDLDRFNRQSGIFRGMSDANYAELRSHAEYRVINDLGNSFWMEFRHFGLITPQGGDPLMPRQYFSVLGTAAGDPATDIDPIRRKDLLQLLGVRYVLSSENGLRLDALMRDPDFRLLPDPAYWKVFEFRSALRPYRLEGGGAGAVDRVTLEPERRTFRVRAADPSRFILVEQFYPGWQAWVDGRAVEVERWHGAFQSISVPAGDHHVEFRFHSRLLNLGAAVSDATLLILVLALWGRPRGATPSAANTSPPASDSTSGR